MKSEEKLDNDQARAIVLVDHLSSKAEMAESSYCIEFIAEAEAKVREAVVGCGWVPQYSHHRSRKIPTVIFSSQRNLTTPKIHAVPFREILAAP